MESTDQTPTRSPKGTDALPSRSYNHREATPPSAQNAQTSWCGRGSDSYAVVDSDLEDEAGNYGMFNASCVPYDPAAETDVDSHEVYDSGNDADVSVNSDSDSDSYAEVLEDSNDSEVIVDRSDDEVYARNREAVFYHGHQLSNFNHEDAYISVINGSDSDLYFEVLEDSNDSEVIVDRSDDEVYARNGEAIYHHGHQLNFNHEDDLLDDGNGSDLCDELVNIDNDDPLDGFINQSVVLEHVHELNNFNHEYADVSVINDSDSDSRVVVFENYDDGEVIVDCSDDEVYVHNGYIVYHHGQRLIHFNHEHDLLDDGNGRDLFDELGDIENDDPFSGFIDQSVVVEHVPFVDWHEIADSVDRYR